MPARSHPIPTALIVGAGIGGLAAGVALRRAGWDVQIFERADSPRELGFGVLLAANALSARRELGVAEAVTSRAARFAARMAASFDGSMSRWVALRSLLCGLIYTAHC